MSLSVCVLDPSRAPDEVGDWGFGEDLALVTGRLGGPEVASRLRTGARPGSHLLLLYRPAQQAEAAFVANVVSGALPALPVTRLAVDVSLLGATVIALEAAHVEGEGDGSRVSRIGRTLAHTVTGVWLTRVTRLTAPSPTFGQHLRSVVPGGPRFVARCGTGGRVEKALAGGYGGGRTGQLVVGAEQGSPGAQRLSAWFGSDDVVYVPPVAASVQGVYGNHGVEFAVVEEVLASPGPQRGRCRVCRDTVHETACPFCHVRPQTREVPTA